MICPFCRREGKSTLEHVFGQQFARRFPAVAAHIATVGDYGEPWRHDTVVKTDDGYVTRKTARGGRSPELHQVKVKTCERCNNGWMADRDTRAVEAFESLTAGGGFRPPTADEAHALAVWLVKMGMAYDLYQPPAEKGYSDRLRHELYETRGIPTGTAVYLGWEPSEPGWVPFWQYGWHVAPVGTPDEVVLTSAPNLSTTFFGLNGLRLVAHRIAPDVRPNIREAATAWVGHWMTQSRMVQIAPELAEGEGHYEAMEPQNIAQGMYVLREFVDRFMGQVAPSET